MNGKIRYQLIMSALGTAAREKKQIVRTSHGFYQLAARVSSNG